MQHMVAPLAPPSLGRQKIYTTTTRGALRAPPPKLAPSAPIWVVVVFMYLLASGRLSQQFVQSFAIPFTVHELYHYVPSVA